MRKQPLLTVDEARRLLTGSARQLLRGIETRDAFLISAMLWGAGDVPTALTDHDRQLADRHRRNLDQLIDAGYQSEIAAELEGISSAAGLDDGTFDLEVITNTL